MTKINRLLILSMLIAIGLLSSCVKEEFVEQDTTTITQPAQEIITTSVFGRVIDKNDQPLANALVTLKSGTEVADVMTDNMGQFAFEGYMNKGASAFLSVESGGKFEAFRRLSVLKDRKNYTEIKMQDKNIIGTVTASQGGILDNSNGAEIELPAGGIVDGNGNAYDGNVNVAMAWIDPSASDLAAQMVGDLSAIDGNGNNRSLATYGMLQVELLDDSNNELNIAPGANATLQFPVPADLQSSAPSVIPLWSYNEDLGTWIEEGSATYQNGVYRGLVSHFSSWNVDFMFDPIEIKGQVKVEIEGTDVSSGYLSVYVTSDVIGKKGGWLCDDGSFRFYNFPKGEQFQLEIYDQCGNLKYQETYGPYDTDQDLGMITVTNSTNMVRAFGIAKDCDGNVVTNAAASVIFKDRVQSFEIKEDGTFDFSIDLCEDGEAEIKIIDLDSLLSVELEINTSMDTWDLGEVLLCQEVEDFISISINGEEPVVFTTGLEANVYADSTGGGNIISITEDFEDTTTGFETAIRLEFAEPTMVPETLNVLQMFIAAENNFLYLESEGDVTVTITAYDPGSGDEDGSISGTFTGTLKFENQGGMGAATIEGQFKLPVD